MASAPATALLPPNDPINAFCQRNHAALSGAAHGPLAGLTFAALAVVGWILTILIRLSR